MKTENDSLPTREQLSMIATVTQRKNPVNTNREKMAMAYHEAGHAVIASVLGILADDSSITIVREGWVAGSVEFSKDSSNNAWKRWGVRYTRKAILAFYAGPAVSIKLDPRLDLFEEGGWYEFDMFGAEEFCNWIGDPAYSYCGPEKKLVLETRNWQKAVSLVEVNWPGIASVADELLKQHTMTGKQVEAAIREGFRRDFESRGKRREKKPQVAS